MLLQRDHINLMLTAINNSKIDISLKKSTKRLAKDLIFHLKPGNIIFLYGEMGVGKTTFVRYLINEFQESKNLDITVKCRIGVDEDNPYLVLPEFIEMLQLAGINRLIIHARKAWLKGISPKQNRDLPPLDYNLIFKMKKIFPNMHLTLNGGVQNITQVKGHLDNGIDGVMIGRSAYYNPVQVLQNIDGEIYQKGIVKNGFEVVEEMLPYI